MIDFDLKEAMMFDKVDDCLLDYVFEPFSWKFQILSGKNCFFLSRIFYTVASVLCALGSNKVMFYYGLSMPSLVVVSIWGGFSISYFMEAFKMQGKEDYDPHKESLAKNPERLNLRDERYSNWNFVFIFLIIYLIDPAPGYCRILVISILSLVAKYFRSCTPLPPQTGKAGEWIIGLLSVPKTAEQRFGSTHR